MDAEEIPSQRINPLTGEWETLTFRQWSLLKCGIILEQQHKVDDWTFAIMRGPIAACCFAFGLEYSTHYATVDWLVEEYKTWKIFGAKALYEWSTFMQRYYDIAEMEFPLRRAIAAKRSQIAAALLAMQLKQALDEERYGIKSTKTKKRRRRS